MSTPTTPQSATAASMKRRSYGDDMKAATLVPLPATPVTALASPTTPAPAAQLPEEFSTVEVTQKNKKVLLRAVRGLVLVGVVVVWTTVVYNYGFAEGVKDEREGGWRRYPF